MVTSNVGTSIGITVSNFFMLTQDGKHIRSFNESKYVITAIEVVMGYWGQLKDSLNPDETNSEKLLQDYFDVKAVNGADKISITNGKPIIVTTEKLPPDSAIHIKGFVADIYSSPVAITKVATPVDALSKPVASSGTDLETLLFEQITRRYASGHKIYAEVDKAVNRKLKTQPPVGAEGSFTGNKDYDFRAVCVRRFCNKSNGAGTGPFRNISKGSSTSCGCCKTNCREI